MNAISKFLSAALLASFVAVAQPSVSLACDKDQQAKEEKKKDESTVAQRDRGGQSNKKEGEQAPNDKQDRQGKAGSSNTARTN
jgi:hypothetical protein